MAETASHCQASDNARESRRLHSHRDPDTLARVTTAHDPNRELNPNLILAGAFILVLAAFGVVTGIILGSEAKNKPAEMQK